MIVLAHRGLWKMPGGKNSILALRNALDAGYGIETDIRDYKGRLVISHDPADESSPDIEELFSYYSKKGCTAYLALNVKADGICGKLKERLRKYGIKNYFVFDMSVPEEVLYMKEGIGYYTRQSDIEHQCVLYEEAKGVWLDSFFDDDWLDIRHITMHLDAGKEVSVISSEIHGRNHDRQWRMLSEIETIADGKIMLCTDNPEIAEVFFNGKD